MRKLHIVLKVRVRRLLREDNPANVLVHTLLTVSQVARLHRDFYKPLLAADLCHWLHALLVHHEAGVRARTCNLLGNLCRPVTHARPKREFALSSEQPELSDARLSPSTSQHWLGSYKPCQCASPPICL